MPYSTGKLAFLFIVASILAALASWLIAWRYRQSVRRLMSAAVAGAPAAAAGPPLAETTTRGSTPRPAPAPLTFADNRRAGWRLSAVLVGLSAVMALTASALEQRFALGMTEFSWKRTATLAAVQAWPLLPALAIVWRWSKTRLLLTLAGFVVAAFVLVLWRSIEPRPAEVALWLAAEIGPPLLVIAFVSLGSATRAIAPWLLPLLLGFVAASMLGIDVFWWLLQRRSEWLRPLIEWLPPAAVYGLFVLLPWLVAWWPLRAASRWLARAYERKWISELTLQFAAVWAIALISRSFGAASELGAGGVIMLLPLLWVPLGFAVAHRAAAADGRPPTLLVLRVFQRDADVQRLFDRVVERWRLTGNTVLIAGTDLTLRTLDAGDVFVFLARRLASRFVAVAADVEARLAELDFGRDRCSRFRINECYCNDATWRLAFARLVDESDVVLMDLRGFQAANTGCRHELASLAAAAQVARVVVLVDDRTDRATADAAVAAAPAGRFVWLAADGAKGHRNVLAALFAAPPPVGLPGPAGAAMMQPSQSRDHSEPLNPGRPR